MELAHQSILHKNYMKKNKKKLAYLLLLFKMLKNHLVKIFRATRDLITNRTNMIHILLLQILIKVDKSMFRNNLNYHKKKWKIHLINLLRINKWMIWIQNNQVLILPANKRRQIARLSKIKSQKINRSMNMTFWKQHVIYWTKKRLHFVKLRVNLKSKLN